MNALLKEYQANVIWIWHYPETPLESVKEA